MKRSIISVVYILGSLITSPVRFLTTLAYRVLPIGGERRSQINLESGCSETGPNILRSSNALILTRENVPNIIGASAITVFATISNFAVAYLFGKTTQALMNNESATIMGKEISSNIMIFLTFFAYSLSQLLPPLKEKLLIPVSARITQQILTNITEHLLAKKSLNYHINTSQSTQMRIVQKGFSLANAYEPVIKNIFPTLLETGIGIITLSYWYGSRMGIGIAATLFLYTAYSLKTTKFLIKSQKQALIAGSAAWKAVTKSIASYKTIHDFGKLQATIEAVEQSTSEATLARIIQVNTPLNINIGQIMIVRACLLATFFFVRSASEQQFAGEELIGLFVYLNQLAMAFPAFGSSVNQLFAATPDLKFVFDELETPSEVVEDSMAELSLEASPSICFDRVMLSYSSTGSRLGKPPVLNDFSLKIKGGQLIALVSESGGGKSTIFNLLYRYYIPNRGRVYIENKDITEFSLDSLRSQITLIGQNPNLFGGTVRDNIIYGMKNSKNFVVDPALSQSFDEEIMSLARMLGLSDFIESFQNGLDTDVGEKGKALSGGQQQKIAILRGFINKSPIILLDEITSALDADSAGKVLNGIKRLTAHGCTCLMITHKLQETSYADKIVVLENGQVLAQGEHDQLIDQCLLYQRLWQLQNSPSMISSERSGSDRYRLFSRLSSEEKSLDGKLSTHLGC